jgi:hypothetical protein
VKSKGCSDRSKKELLPKRQTFVYYVYERQFTATAACRARRIRVERRIVEMIVPRRLLAAASLAILVWVAGCETPASRNGAAEGDKKNAMQEEVTGKVVRATPCRTLVEIDAEKASERGKTARMQFFCFDAEARESVQGVEKGDTVKIQYVFSPETQRNSVRQITKVTRENGSSVPQ